MTTCAPDGFRYAHCPCCEPGNGRICKDVPDGQLHAVSCPTCEDATLVPVEGARATGVGLVEKTRPVEPVWVVKPRSA